MWTVWEDKTGEYKLVKNPNLSIIPGDIAAHATREMAMEHIEELNERKRNTPKKGKSVRKHSK